MKKSKNNNNILNYIFTYVSFRINALIGVTTQKIYLGKGSSTLNKNYTRNDFLTIINYTDRDEDHKKNLEKLDISLCRYKDVYPYKKNVIPISTDHKYINASFINIFFKNSFIASQGPNDNTIDDFWTMCFEQKVSRILMLCNEVEDNKKKCSNYWDSKMISKNFINQGTEIVDIGQDTNNIIEKKTIKIFNKTTNETREFHHMHFKKWPDHSTPNIRNVVFLFEKLFNFVNERYNNNNNNNNNKNKNKDNQIQTPNPPVVVHCSAGIGRTGVFLTLYAICQEIKNQIEKPSSDTIIFNVFNFVRKLKEMRLFSVENINQYNFIYNFIEEYLKEKNTQNQGNKN